MKRKIILPVFCLLLIAINSCDNNPIGTVLTSEPQPGRRDYIWDEITLPVPQGEFAQLWSIWGSSPTDLWAVGDGSLSSLGIWHYNGITWTNVLNSGTNGGRSIWGSSFNSIWMGNTDGNIWHFDGTAWIRQPALQIKDYQNFLIQNMIGYSSSEIYAVGSAYLSWFNSENISVIFNYDGKNWTRLNIPDSKLEFADLRKAKNGDLVIVAFDGNINSTQIISWNGSEYKYLFKDTGIASYNVTNIKDQLFFNIHKLVYHYELDGSYKVWEDFSGTDFGKIICARNENDIFISSSSLKGINHYNGIDLQLIYAGANTNVTGGIIFENDVYFTAYDPNSSSPKIIHGQIKNKEGGVQIGF